MVRLWGIYWNKRRDLIALSLASALAITGVAILNHLAHATAATPANTGNTRVAVTSASHQSITPPSGQPNSSSSNEEFLNSDQSSSGDQASSKTTVTVNGQNIPVPQTGSYSKTIHNGNTTTQISGNNSVSGQTSNSYSYSSNITTGSSTSNAAESEESQ